MAALNDVSSKEFEYGIFSGFPAGENLANGAYKFVEIDSSEIVITGAGEQPAGILVSGVADESYCDVKFSGMFILKVDGSGTAIAVGDYLKSDASGVGVKADTDKDLYGAMALEASAAAGDYILVILTHGSVSTT